jgi:hypothetical protein
MAANTLCTIGAARITADDRTVHSVIGWMVVSKDDDPKEACGRERTATSNDEYLVPLITRRIEIWSGPQTWILIADRNSNEQCMNFGQCIQYFLFLFLYKCER